MNRILVAPLNWGLGHATRCIPVINMLKKKGVTPVIASDGPSLSLLKKEFPENEFIELPGYNIRYTKSGGLLKWKLLTDTPKLMSVIKKEHELVKSIVKTHRIDGIISDNRFGIYHPEMPSVFITHQVQIQSGNTSWISSKVNQGLINKFDECWIPDLVGDQSISGKLSDHSQLKIPVRHLGILSRFSPSNEEFQYDLLVLLSGPEPQRSLLEALVTKELKTFDKKILLVKGVIEDQQQWDKADHITSVNYLSGSELESAIKASKLVLSRSGYSTVMDLARLGKKAFFIPTPGQTEQLYLAMKLEEDKIAPFCSQKQFSMDQFERLAEYSGFSVNYEMSNLEDALSFFESK